LPDLPGYDVLGELGRGGMGVVYQARQVTLGRVVAVKVILAGEHAGPDALARFRREAEAAARLQHPNIVQIHDIAEHQGRPYFSMEYVPGGSLAQRLIAAPLEPRPAAELVQSLACAVQFAHERGIVHRDLKPANVLLTAEGQPKVGDFGLAKRLDGGPTPTQTGAVMGTPSYMAPEQAEGKAREVGPATDVYALGSILYESLVGRPPFRAATPVETLRQVLSDEPLSPSRLQPKVPRDLETVCLKCLEKDPSRRYESARALMEDLGRFLAGEPVRARAVGPVGRLWRWYRRRPAVASLLVALVLSLSGGLAGVTWKWQDAVRQQLIAEANARRALEAEQRAVGAEREAAANAERARRGARSASLISDLLVSVFEVSNPRDILDQIASRVEKELADQPVDQARLMDAMGNVYRSLRLYSQAEPLLRRAAEIRMRVLGQNDPAYATSLNSLALFCQAQVRYGEAETLLRQAVNISRLAMGTRPAEYARNLDNLAAILGAQGRYAEAVTLCEEALRIRRTVLGDVHPSTALSYNNVAANLEAQGRYAEAQPLFERALRIFRTALGEGHPDTAQSYTGVALSLQAQGRYAEAEPLFEKALHIRRAVFGEAHQDTARSYNDVALNLHTQGRCGEAGPLFEKALQIRRSRLGENHPDTATSYNDLALTLDAQGRYAEAKPLYEKALGIRRAAVGEDHPDTARSYSNLAANLLARGCYAEAEANWTKAATRFEVARLRSGQGGLASASFGHGVAPWLSLAACRARLGWPAQAWRSLEAGLARGLLDDISARKAPDLTAPEPDQRQQLTTRLTQLDRQIIAVLAVKEQTDQVQAQFRELARQRQEVQDELGRLAANLSGRQLCSMERIRTQIPADTALIAWVDVKGQPKAKDPNGEHWACVLRHTGPPAWVKLPGSGDHGAWTPDDDELPGRFRQWASKPPGKDREDFVEVTRQLAAQRLAPLASQLAAGDGLPPVRHLVVVPVAEMAGVPVEAFTDRYAVSYVSSGTLFARQAELRKKVRSKEGALRLLAVGDPAFGRAPDGEPPAPPPDGVLLVRIEPDSNAVRSGLQPGDVLLSYAGRKLLVAADLSAAIKAMAEEKPAAGSGGQEGIGVRAWRAGRVLSLKVQPGRLGVVSSPGLAEEIRTRVEGDQALRARRPKASPRLPGTRREVEAIAGLFPQACVLLGQDASAGRVQELATTGELGRYSYMHFATHAEADLGVAFNSALILAPDARVVGTGPAEGQENHSRLTAAQMLRWKLNAALVVLSASESGLGRPAGGEGYLGFSQALLLAGSRTVVLSLWNVDDTATALLMIRFYQNLLGKRNGLAQPLPKAEALREAKRWLRGLSRQDAGQLTQGLRAEGNPKTTRPASAGNDTDRPYAHPYFWAAFIVIGDPQ
jgi:serine/threonine-protein kinase